MKLLTKNYIFRRLYGLFNIIMVCFCWRITTSTSVSKRTSFCGMLYCVYCFHIEMHCVYVSCTVSVVCSVYWTSEYVTVSVFSCIEYNVSMNKTLYSKHVSCIHVEAFQTHLLYHKFYTIYNSKCWNICALYISIIFATLNLYKTAYSNSISIIESLLLYHAVFPLMPSVWAMYHPSRSTCTFYR